MISKRFSFVAFFASVEASSKRQSYTKFTYILTYLFTNSLTPYITVLKKLTDFQLVKKLPTFKGN